MSRTLYRPMFRRGGSTGEGITSGLAPRQRYEEAGAVGGDLRSADFKTQRGSNSLNFLNTPPPELPRSTAGADFWLNLGTNILAQPGGKPILQTLGTAGKEPLARFQQQRGQEKLLEYKHGQAERQFQLEWYKALNPDEKLKVQKEMEWYIKKGYSEQEAMDAVMHRKPMHPKEKAYQEEKTAKSDFDLRINRLIDDNDDIQFRDQAEVLLQYRDNRQKWADQKLDQDTSQIYIDIDDMNKNLEVNQEGTEWTPKQGANLDGEYLINKIYVDLDSGNVYLWDGISFKLQELNATNIEQ